MHITVEQNEVSFDQAAARRIVDQIKAKPTSVIGLSTGRTTGNIHRQVVEMYNDEPFDVSRAFFFGIDEVVGVPRTYSGACYTMLRTEMLDGLGVDENHFLMLPTESDDYVTTCRAFTRRLQALGGIDLLILGLGENGHLGFNQPGTPFGSTAWVSTMTPELEARIRRETDTPPTRQLAGVTLGIRDIMQAHRIVLVAKGHNKTHAVRNMLYGAVKTALPASVLQLHPFCEFLLDADAASLL